MTTHPSLRQAVQDCFAPEGALAQSLPQFVPRASQTQLALAVADAIDQKTRLVAEAGTGVGKTFAYLVPALLSGQRIILSTATKTLQDQLFHRELPRICEALRISANVVLLKGRSNYLCPYRIEKAAQEARFASAHEAADFRVVQQFARLPGDGDIAGCKGIPEHASIWPVVTSTAENCLGSACPKLGECPVIQVRERAAQAELVVVNHHLLCADWVLRQEGGGDLLPNADLVVVDEAHSLQETATQFFSQSLSSTMLALFSRELLAAGLAQARDAADWASLCGRLDAATLNLRSAAADGAAAPGSGAGDGSAAQNPGLLGRADSLLPGMTVRKRWAELDPGHGAALGSALSVLEDALADLLPVLELARSRHPELEKLAQRLGQITLRLSQVQPAGLVGRADVDGVRWLERSRNSVSLHWAPVDLSGPLSSVFHSETPKAWALVSATLCTGSAEAGFDYFCGRLGLQPELTLRLDSPFDYPQQALLLVPENLPDPKNPRLMEALLGLPGLWPLMRQSVGGIFLLCTSHRAVQQAASWFQADHDRLDGRLLLVQGSNSRDELLRQFREDGRAVLVGSASFWEGVDVPGQALSVVMIDKLPFAPPDDPVLEARIQQCKEQGGEPFMSIQLPEATLSLKQGVGRLIRSEADRGLLVIGDRRIAETGYGRRMLKGLPPFRRTRSLEEALEFLPKA